MHDNESTVLEEKDCLAGGNGCEAGGEIAADGLNPPAAEQAECTLILWAVARGLRPAEGWFKAVGLSERQVASLVRQHGGQLARLRQLHTAGELLDDAELLVLLRARLAEGLIEAKSVKELSEVARMLEKLPHAASPAETDEDDLSLEEAIAEARRLLNELENDPYDKHPALRKPQLGPDGAAR